MKEKCEICGSNKELEEVFCRPAKCAKTIFSATLCKHCKIKYASSPIQYYYAENTFSENLVRNYKSKKSWLKGSRLQEMSKLFESAGDF